MSDQRDALSTIVRALFGGLGGVIVGLGWLWYLTPLDSPIMNWIIVIAGVVICAVLAVKLGDDFWERVFAHL